MCTHTFAILRGDRSEIYSKCARASGGIHSTSIRATGTENALLAEEHVCWGPHKGLPRAARRSPLQQHYIYLLYTFYTHLSFFSLSRARASISRYIARRARHFKCCIIHARARELSLTYIYVCIVYTLRRLSPIGFFSSLLEKNITIPYTCY